MTAPLQGILHHLTGLAGAQALAETADAALLERFAGRHDPNAFAVLLRRHGPLVLGVCRRLLRHTQDAEDVFQATFLLLARKAGSIRKRASVGSWLYGVAYRLAWKARTRDQRRLARERRVGVRRQDAPGVQAAWQEVQAALHEALAQLPARYRDPLVLCYLEETSHEEAARALGCPLATLRSRLARGRDRLRGELARCGLTLSAAALGALLAAASADAAPPAALVQLTLEAALRFAAGQPAGQVVSCTTARLVERGLNMMLLGKVKLGAAVVMLLALVTAGVGLTAREVLLAQQPQAREDRQDSPPAEKDNKPIRDLVVEVKDEAGKPVAGAEVGFLVKWRPVVTGRTDAEGRWKGSVPAGAKGWSVFARKAKVGFDFVAGEKSGDVPDRLTLTLDGARTFRVKTVDRHGKPLAGVKVAPTGIYKPGREGGIYFVTVRSLWAVTDKEGVAVIDWLPRRLARGLLIQAWSPEHYAFDHGVTLTPDNPAVEATVTLLPLEQLSGRVTHPDGRPAAKIPVSLQGSGAGDAGFNGSTRTDADGCYSLKVYSEQVYVITAGNERWATPYRSNVVVRAGKPVTGVDFVLGRATRVHGRVTVGKDNRPVANAYLSAQIRKGEIPAELKRKEDKYYRWIGMDIGAQTDQAGRFQLHLGPGEYHLGGPARTAPVKITIPADNPPEEIVQDFHMQRPETGPLTVRVVDGEGRPVRAATVVGYYESAEARRWFHEVKTDAAGSVRVERSLDALLLHAETADKLRAGVARVTAEATRAEVVIRPVTTAVGRLLDHGGKPVSGRKLLYGIRVYMGEAGNSPFMDVFGNMVTTDSGGRFTLTGLVLGEPYQVNFQYDKDSSVTVTEVRAKTLLPVHLGDLKVDPNPPRPYVPPTPAQRAADAFKASRGSPRERLHHILVEAQREYTRPLLLLGEPKDSACVDLFRLFYEDPEPGKTGEKRSPTPQELRWQFELAALDSGRPEIGKLAGELGITIGNGKPPILVVLDDRGAVVDSHALRLGDRQRLDSRSLSAFLAKHKPATRDAERMLADGLTRAKAEKKRVFFIASASWCGPCRLLARFLAAHKGELEQHYVFVKLDISRDAHAEVVWERFRGKQDGGVPWYAILDADGKVLTTSNLAKKSRFGTTNAGFPSDPEGIEHFLKMLAKTAPGLSEEELARLRKELGERK